LLWLRLALRGPFVFSPRVTAFYRQRPGSLVTSYKGPKELHYLTVLARLKQDVLNAGQQKVLRQIEAECHHVSALHYRRSRDYTNGVRHAWAAVKLDYLRLTYWKLFAATCIEYSRAKI
jgi:hypothetical protein